MGFENILFVLRSPIDRNGSGVSKITRRISCRLVRSLPAILADRSRPLGESIDASIISMRVEQTGEAFLSDAYAKAFEICARCGSEMQEDECTTCAPSVPRSSVFSSGGLTVPEKVERFLGTLGHVFEVNPGVARGYEYGKWARREQAVVALSMHRGEMMDASGASLLP